jgi:hypothetical protein
VEHYRTKTRTNKETGEDESGVLVRNLGPGQHFATEDGAFYKVQENGSLKRLDKTKGLSKKDRRKARELKRAALRKALLDRVAAKEAALKVPAAETTNATVVTGVDT